MDGFGSVGTSTSLLVQAFHLFRHVSAARRFADTAAIEYFRFETWLQQSNLLTIDPTSGTLVVTESSLRRAILIAADAQSLTMDYHRIENHVLTVISQVYECLQAIQKMREKYSLQNDADDVESTSPSELNRKAVDNIPSGVLLFQNTRVAAEITREMGIRQRRAKTMSFFRKVTFTWSLKDDASDHNRLIGHVQTLKACNDALRELLPQQQRQAADRLINVKALALTDSAPELQGIGDAASALHSPLHDQIFQAMMIKAKRVGESSQELSAEELDRTRLKSETLVFDRDDGITTTGIPHRIMAQHRPNAQTTEAVIIEWATFNASLPEEDLELLNERIAHLCTLLRSAGHPYFPALPLCTGFFRQGRTSFALVYQLPHFAVPAQPPRSLYSLLPRNKYSDAAEKASTNSNITALPTLEQRYELAAALADAVLSLISVNWMHKTITSRNVVLYPSREHSAVGLNRIGFGSPQLLGFGLARRERPGEHHRRFEQRFDIFSLGVVLFEIGMWQDAHFYSSSGSDSRPGPASGSGEFRRRLLHVCAREMAHRMGEAYKSAVMACLDGDETWTGAHRPEDPDQDDMQINGGVTQGANLAELFYLQVYSVLRGCCK
ncbi:hypothetical protein NEMBOFW57_009095 [Staphylotrichum longicolle]|uniref:Protein kinase domain-containing protein n=1 Tax=Staphylotrichum longicolle TaxID=669026 RepID=A0AAD4ET11_9PEZI|nr:hypothetical protein NEMBOFW57_009095 [Staphylotrichum longicolle]